MWPDDGKTTLVSDIEAMTRLVLHGHERVRIGTDWAQIHTRNPFWRLYIHDREGAEVWDQGRVHPLAPGRVHLIPAWLTLNYFTRRPLAHFYVHFSLIRWNRRVTRQLAPGPVSLPLDSPVGATWEAVQAAYDRDLEPSPMTSMRVTALVQSALAQWLDTLDQTEVRRALYPTGGGREVEPALSYIEGHLGQSIDNPTLAALCHLSVDHFIKVFGRVMGQTPGRYVSERRVAAAAQAIGFTDRSIEDIARSLGFANRFYFTRVFKQHLGVPPAAYRANHGVG